MYTRQKTEVCFQKSILWHSPFPECEMPVGSLAINSVFISMKPSLRHSVQVGGCAWNWKSNFISPILNILLFWQRSWTILTALGTNTEPWQLASPTFDFFVFRVIQWCHLFVWNKREDLTVKNGVVDSWVGYISCLCCISEEGELHVQWVIRNVYLLVLYCTFQNYDQNSCKTHLGIKSRSELLPLRIHCYTWLGYGVQRWTVMFLGRGWC